MSDKINYDVGAQVQVLNQVFMEFGGATKVWDGTLAGAVRYVLALPSEEQGRVWVLVDHGSGLRTTAPNIGDVEEIARRPDFPPPDDE